MFQQKFVKSNFIIMEVNRKQIQKIVELVFNYYKNNIYNIHFVLANCMVFTFFLLLKIIN